MSGGTLKSRGAVFSTTIAASRFNGGWSLTVTSAGDERSRDSDAVASVSRLRNEQECFFSGHDPLFAQQHLPPARRISCSPLLQLSDQGTPK